MKHKVSKCEFWLEKIKFLGREVSAAGLAVDEAKVDSIVHWKRPENVSGARSFLGLFGYYRRFIEGYVKIEAPLTKLTCKNTAFKWSDGCEKSFQELKRRLTTSPVLVLPQIGEKYTIYTDASYSVHGSQKS